MQKYFPFMDVGDFALAYIGPIIFFAHEIVIGDVHLEIHPN